MVEGSKNFIACSSFGCCYPSPPLLANFSLPVRGYVPGQTIPIKVNIKNESGVEVSSVKLSLERVKYFLQNIFFCNIQENSKILAMLLNILECLGMFLRVFARSCIFYTMRKFWNIHDFSRKSC